LPHGVRRSTAPSTRATSAREMDRGIPASWQAVGHSTAVLRSAATRPWRCAYRKNTRSTPQPVRTVVLARPAPERSATNALRIAGDSSASPATPILSR
jgi:hypothetical protein